LGPVEKANCLELLNTANHGKRILLVEHESELKTSIKDTIKVVRNYEVSNIKE
jgi:hypothetical protein